MNKTRARKFIRFCTITGGSKYMSVESKLGPSQKAWVAALRSGKYEQGREELKTQCGKYCCLGVACEISGSGEMSYGNAIGIYGLIQDSSLIQMNDTEKKSFEEIADYIESDPPGLFKEYV